jgi:hypothetical protein
MCTIASCVYVAPGATAADCGQPKAPRRMASAQQADRDEKYT